ncbi:MAG: hypothetical protein AB1797_07115 [bacterium]
MIKSLAFKDKDRKTEVKVDLSRLEPVIEEAKEFIQFERDGFYQEVSRVLKDERGDDVVSTMNRLKEALDRDGTITDLKSFKEGISRIIDTIDYLADLFGHQGLFLTATKLGEIKLKLPIPDEFSIPKDEMEIALSLASQGMKVGRDYFVLGITIPKRKYFERAKDYFEEALSGFKKYGEDELAGQIHLALAIIYDLLVEAEKSVKHFEGAISQFSNLRFDLSYQTERKKMLKRAALIEIGVSLMDNFKDKERHEPGRRHRLEMALDNFRKAEPDYYASFIHYLALIEVRGGYARMRKRLSMESRVKKHI